MSPHNIQTRKRMTKMGLKGSVAVKRGRGRGGAKGSVGSDACFCSPRRRGRAGRASIQRAASGERKARGHFSESNFCWREAVFEHFLFSANMHLSAPRLPSIHTPLPHLSICLYICLFLSHTTYLLVYLSPLLSPESRSPRMKTETILCARTEVASLTFTVFAKVVSSLSSSSSERS